MGGRNRRLGNRLECIRVEVFDLAGNAAWDTHFLAFSYGDWMHLLGINQGVEKMMRSDLSRLSQLTDLGTRSAAAQCGPDH